MNFSSARSALGAVSRALWASLIAGAFFAVAHAEDAPAAAAPVSVAMTPPPATITVPFDFPHRAIVISVKVNGVGPMSMMLDSGADPSVLDLATARKMGLKLSSTGVQGSGVGTDRNPGYETELPEVEIGSLTARHVKAVALDLSKISQSLGRHLDGVLGYSLLENRIVRIDYPRREVEFFSAPIPSEKSGESSTKLHFRYDDFIFVEGVTVNGKKLVANFDTGSSSAFQLTADAISALNLDDNAGRGQAITSTGFNGSATSRTGSVDVIKLGDIFLKHPAVVFLSKGTGRDNEGWDLRVGNGFLQDYVLTIDYRNMMITLEKG